MELSSISSEQSSGGRNGATIGERCACLSPLVAGKANAYHVDAKTSYPSCLSIPGTNPLLNATSPLLANWQDSSEGQFERWSYPAYLPVYSNRSLCCLFCWPGHWWIYSTMNSRNVVRGNQPATATGSLCKCNGLLSLLVSVNRRPSSSVLHSVRYMVSRAFLEDSVLCWWGQQ
ncbi:hypothetical protein CC80DRAFT_142083 [Byssothecium circinans]|uniref:Uncharacterized protein n=1 Tax=Byssothecium circinans TaxID=147558 RepID=A0A6A5TLN5_9PLEO|nr:hypothetical protein CC80DRAFT_142083 [Byssothecium circinans]